MLRVRFAPSPTGYLHIGSARTFIFNWLYARRHGGTMILRLDDTDVERNTQVSVDSIFDGLKWLGLEWDEYYRQSDRLALHQQMAWKIFEAGLAYRDFTPADAVADTASEATTEAAPTGPGAASTAPSGGMQWLCNPGMRELSRAESDARAAAGEPFVLRFRVPRDPARAVTFHDGVYGPQTKSTADIEDFALLRSSGLPTYHMASCADDVDLRITQIIRGQDHLTNTFKHVLIFEALGCSAQSDIAPLPSFAHLPLLIAPDGSKLSKRKHGPVVSVTTYRDRGFLPHGYVNFLCLLGWSPKDNREQMTRQEIQSIFGFEGINRSNAVVNFTEEDPIDPKALWLNAQHLRSLPVEELLPGVTQELEKAGLPVPPPERLAEIVGIIRARYNTFTDFVSLGRPYFAEELSYDSNAAAKLAEPGTRELLRELGARLAATEEFSEAHIEKTLRDLATEKGVKAGVLINGSRAILTGQSVGPSAFAVFTAVGRERALRRLQAA